VFPNEGAFFGSSKKLGKADLVKAKITLNKIAGLS